MDKNQKRLTVVFVSYFLSWLGFFGILAAIVWKVYNLEVVQLGIPLVKKFLESR